VDVAFSRGVFVEWHGPDGRGQGIRR
jgi:hypothetical protein